MSDEDSLKDWVRELDFELTAPEPNNNFTSFSGKIVVPSDIKNQSLTIDNLLLRGTKIRTQGWVVAVIVYTGIHTKIMINNKRNVRKTSRLEK